MSKIFKWFVNIIFVIVIALLLIYLVLRTTDKIEIYRVKTGSMEEKIHVGDYILIYRKDIYNVGDVVTYTSNDGFITHRIIKKEGGKVITKGDANNAEDKEIVESTIVGKVIIIGGILNIVITYKYVIVCVLLSLYLFSCYFEGRKKEKFVTDDKDLKEKSEKEEDIDSNDDKDKIIKEESSSEEVLPLKEEVNGNLKEESNSVTENKIEESENTKEEEKVENKENFDIEDSPILEKKENAKKKNKKNYNNKK